jgi:hypothetical protein
VFGALPRPNNLGAAKSRNPPRVDHRSAKLRLVGLKCDEVALARQRVSAKALTSPCLLNTNPTRVLFDGDRASGVEIVSGEVVRTVEATREVILAAGTIARHYLRQRNARVPGLSGWRRLPDHGRRFSPSAAGHRSGYCCNGSCGTSARVRALALSMEAGSGPRPSAKAASSTRRPCRSPGRP